MSPEMALPLRPPFSPMEALSVDQIPVGRQWQYEPKWDGFRCLTFRDGKQVYLQSKSGQPLARYFPDIVEALERLGLTFDDFMRAHHYWVQRMAKDEDLAEAFRRAVR